MAVIDVKNVASAVATKPTWPSLIGLSLPKIKEGSWGLRQQAGQLPVVVAMRQGGQRLIQILE